MRQTQLAASVLWIALVLVSGCQERKAAPVRPIAWDVQIRADKAVFSPKSGDRRLIRATILFPTPLSSVATDARSPKFEAPLGEFVKGIRDYYRANPGIDPGKAARLSEREWPVLVVSEYTDGQKRLDTSMYYLRSSALVSRGSTELPVAVEDLTFVESVTGNKNLSSESRQTLETLQRHSKAWADLVSAD